MGCSVPSDSRGGFSFNLLLFMSQSSHHSFASLSIVDDELYYDAEEYLLPPASGGSTRHVVAGAPPVPYVPPVPDAEYAVSPSSNLLDPDPIHHAPVYLDLTSLFPGMSGKLLIISPSADRTFRWARLSPTAVRDIKVALSNVVATAASVPSTPASGSHDLPLRPPSPKSKSSRRLGTINVNR